MANTRIPNPRRVLKPAKMNPYSILFNNYDRLILAASNNKELGPAMQAYHYAISNGVATVETHNLMMIAATCCGNLFEVVKAYNNALWTRRANNRSHDCLIFAGGVFRNRDIAKHAYANTRSNGKRLHPTTHLKMMRAMALCNEFEEVIIAYNNSVWDGTANIKTVGVLKDMLAHFGVTVDINKLLNNGKCLFYTTSGHSMQQNKQPPVKALPSSPIALKRAQSNPELYTKNEVLKIEKSGNCLSFRLFGYPFQRSLQERHQRLKEACDKPFRPPSRRPA